MPQKACPSSVKANQTTNKGKFLYTSGDTVRSNHHTVRKNPGENTQAAYIGPRSSASKSMILYKTVRSLQRCSWRTLSDNETTRGTGGKTSDLLYLSGLHRKFNRLFSIYFCCNVRFIFSRVSGHHALTFILLYQFLIFFTTHAKSNRPSLPLRSGDCLYEGT
jgi:hypothetical protein